MNGTSAWALGWRSLWRDLRAGELKLLLLAVALAVAALTAVAFLAERIQGGLQRDARQLLGGDAVLAADTPLAPEYARMARAQGLRAATTVVFPTMARADETRGGQTRLVALKAVEPGYPLRGTLGVARAPDGPPQALAQGPSAGSAWVDAGVLDALGLAVGDDLLLGNARLRIDRILVTEPDRGSGFLNFAPRVMIASADLLDTGLVQPASRLTFRLAVAGEDAAVARWLAEVKPRVEAPASRGLRLETLEVGRPEMRQTLDRAEKFLRLVALLSALLSAVAVALAARSFAGSRLDACAMLRVLGLSQRRMAGAYVLEFTVAGLAAGLVGVLLGYAVHFIFVALLGGLVDAALPQPGIWPVLLGLGTALTLLIAFGLPPVLQLAQVPALRVIRREAGSLKPASLGVMALGAIGFAGLLLVVSADFTLGLAAVGGFAGAVALFALAAWACLKLIARLPLERLPQWLGLALRQLAARPAMAVVQVSALSVGLLALVLLVLLRTDLIDSWRSATPPDAADRFVINIQPDQADGVRAALASAGVARYDWFPMVRGRLVAINGQDIDPAALATDRARRMVDREFNLSHAARQPAHNLVPQGRWQEGEQGAVSVEESVMSTLSLKLGDRLRFDIAGQPVESVIRSVRKVDWGSMRANFYVMYPVDQLDGVPLTYLAAFKTPPAPGFERELQRDFPNLTQVDMRATVAQVQKVLDQVIRAVEFLFGFTLAAGLVVLLAALSASREERVRELAVMRALGASAALLRRMQRAEVAGLGLLAGTLAALAALGIAAWLALKVFEFEPSLSPLTPLLGALSGALLALGASAVTLRGLLARPVVESLRQSAE